MKFKNYNRCIRFIVIAFLIFFIFNPASVLSQETYKFERMWPVVKQPWYFASLAGIAIDDKDFVYVADMANQRIHKFTKDGFFENSWGKYGTGDGEFLGAGDIAIDSRGFVYVTDVMNHRVQKFTQDGVFFKAWGSEGSSNGLFNRPAGIAVDINDNIYVADLYNHRIQKFTSEGEFVKTWGQKGSEDGEFNEPHDIAIDTEGHLYVVDGINDRIQKFDSDGNSLKWEGKADHPIGITVDGNNFVYVTEGRKYNCIKKFDSNGKYIETWTNPENGEYEFIRLEGLATDSNNAVYVTDTQKASIQIFDSNGNFKEKWGAEAADGGMLNFPGNIFMDSEDNLYVADSRNNRIQKFDAEGRFLNAWGSSEQFNEPSAVATDSNGNMYVADSGNDCIQKLSKDGTFIKKWGSEGSENGQFKYPRGIAVDSSDRIYVADTQNSRIQIFTSDGKFLEDFGLLGLFTDPYSFNNPLGLAIHKVGNNEFLYVADAGNFRVKKYRLTGDTESDFVTMWFLDGISLSAPAGITVDNEGYVYVSDVFANCIYKFTSEGNLITRFGKTGSSPGQFSFPAGVAVSSSGKIYISDTGNNRIQVFKKGLPADKLMKAVIVAGRREEGDYLWDATQMNANFAYRALTYQGFTKETIYYLSSDTNLDLDQNGELDDIDETPTIEHLRNAITEWAKDAESLVVYLVDHGGTDIFYMGPDQQLNKTELYSCLDEFQKESGKEIILIYDACYSGSFLSGNIHEGKNRILITSSSENEPATFLSSSPVSFSSYFWSSIFNGLSIQEAFDHTEEAIQKYQNPVIYDAEKTASSAYIGIGALIQGDAPIIGSVSAEQTISGTSSATLQASDITDTDNIARVWAVIRPPDYHVPDVLGARTIIELPTIELTETNGHYEGTYEEFNKEGTYQIAIYARDRAGNTSIPKITSVNVENPLRRRAIIVAGESSDETLQNAVVSNVRMALTALKFQGYSDDDIYLMSPKSIPDVTTPFVLPTLYGLKHAISTWSEENTRDLLIYMTGKGDEQGFHINDTETLLAASDDGSGLKSWLDGLQNDTGIPIILIYDADNAFSFVKELTEEIGFFQKIRFLTRILIASTENTAIFESDGTISFSNCFWKNVLNGIDIRDSFEYAEDYVNPQKPQMDINGDGLFSEKDDRNAARYYTIGIGIMLAGLEPTVTAVSPEQTLHGENSAVIWAKADSITQIEKVLAVITSSENSQPVSIELVYNDSTDTYEETYDDFTSNTVYNVAVYAKDTNGNLSMPLITKVHRSLPPDEYEEDNSSEQSRIIIIADEPQQHNFHNQSDEDWIKFYGLANVDYEISISNVGANCDPMIEIYDNDGKTMLLDKAWDKKDDGEDELLKHTFDKDAIYYVRLTHADPQISGDDTEYSVRIYHPTGEELLNVTGKVTDADTKGPIDLAKIRTNANSSAVSQPDGDYMMLHSEGTFTITVEADGYIPAALENVSITKDISISFELCKDSDRDRDGTFDCHDKCPDDPDKTVPDENGCRVFGDIDCDRDVDITDLIIVLQELAGMKHDNICIDNDINKDGRIGLEEAVYILMALSDN